MPYISLVDRPRGLLRRYAWWYSRRTFGRVVDPVRAQALHPGVLMASGALEMVVDKRWTKLDPHLRWLAVQATSGAIGCSWCIDYGYFEGVQSGIDPRKVRDVPQWHTSDVYDDTERAVLAYCEAVNAAPSTVDQGHLTELRKHLTEPEVIELAAWVALENYRSRFNAAVGLTSEGFSDACKVPAVA